MGPEQVTVQKDSLELADEEGNLDGRDASKEQETSNEEDVQGAKSPAKAGPSGDRASSDGEQSQEDDEYMELAY